MPNALIHETSPYLLQHAHNPVQWQAWNEASLARAQREQKLMLVSIGYAACHWCHVMERECFEDPEVAALMNAHFVCIKVDREERPDIDQLYMDAVVALNGSGGWPLNCFTLPDGRPLTGGTYFPRERWMQTLEQLARHWQDEPAQLLQYAERLTDALREMGAPAPISGAAALTPEMLLPALRKWTQEIDYQHGGRRVSANKFPLPLNQLALLRAGWLLQRFDPREESQALAHQLSEGAHIALERMALGGIYDQLGGGFARYSVDPHWKVPHFEKMLYDNAQLISVYAEAWQATPAALGERRELYRKTVYETLDFVAREMRSPEGGFYAAYDADSEGEEGKFYAWTYEELHVALAEEARLFADYYNAHPQGNWEHGKNVLYALETEAQFARRWGLDPEDFSLRMARCRQRLFELRNERTRPALDDKQLAAWNALMLKGCVDAYRVFEEPRFLEMALDNARFLSEKLIEGPRIWRSYKGGDRRINGFLEDYAFCIDAFVALYQVTFDEQWIEKAGAFVDHVFAHFSDPESGLFFFSSDEDPPLAARKRDTADDVIPSAISALAHSLHTLSAFSGRMAWRHRAERMMQQVQEGLLNTPSWHANWMLLALRSVFPDFDIAVTGPDALANRFAVGRRYYPQRSFAGAEAASDLDILQHRFKGVTAFYVCEGQSCRQVAHAPEEVWAAEAE